MMKMIRPLTRLTLWIAGYAIGLLGLYQTFAAQPLAGAPGTHLLIAAAILLGSSGMIDKLEQIRKTLT